MSYDEYQAGLNKNLIDAATKNNIKEMEEAIAKGADLFGLQSEILSVAERLGNVDAALFIIEAANEQIVKIHLRESLLLAIEKNDLQMAKLLLDNGADATNTTGIKAAAAKGREDMLRLLLEHGAVINMPSSEPKEFAANERIDFEVAIGDVKVPLYLQAMRDDDDEGTFVVAFSAVDKALSGEDLWIGHIHVPDEAMGNGEETYGIGDIEVGEEYRRKGIATKMLDFMSETLKAKPVGADSVFSATGKLWWNSVSSRQKESRADDISLFKEETVGMPNQSDAQESGINRRQKQ